MLRPIRQLKLTLKAAKFKQHVKEHAVVVHLGQIWRLKKAIKGRDNKRGVYNMRGQKLAFDKERFELILYGFFSKEETDLIISIVWRSWSLNGGLDEVVVVVVHQMLTITTTTSS